MNDNNDPVWEEVWDYYGGRCVVCLAPASHVHEVRPKSLNSQWRAFENRVTLCATCHDKVHKEGTKKWADRLIRHAVSTRHIVAGKE